MTNGPTFGDPRPSLPQKPTNCSQGTLKWIPFSKGFGAPHVKANTWCFFWLLLMDRLSTRNMLRRKRMHLDDYNCVLCQQLTEETIMHLLFYCPFAVACWDSLNFGFADNLPVPQIFAAWRVFLNAPFALDIFILACWSIWMMRNDVIFRNKVSSVQDFKRNLTVEALLLLHRSKARFTPSLESWIQINL